MMVRYGDDDSRVLLVVRMRDHGSPPRPGVEGFVQDDVGRSTGDEMHVTTTPRTLGAF